MPSVIRANTCSSVASRVSTGARVISEARILSASECVCSGMIVGRGTGKFCKHTQNCPRERRRDGVGHLTHLVRKRAVYSKIIRETLKPRSLAHGDAA